MDFELAEMLLTGNYVLGRIPEAVEKGYLKKVGIEPNTWLHVPFLAWVDIHLWIVHTIARLEQTNQGLLQAIEERPLETYQRALSDNTAEILRLRKLLGNNQLLTGLREGIHNGNSRINFK